jgi:hypothetical protein
LRAVVNIVVDAEGKLTDANVGIFPRIDKPGILSLTPIRSIVFLRSPWEAELVAGGADIESESKVRRVDSLTVGRSVVLTE